MLHRLCAWFTLFALPATGVAQPPAKGDARKAIRTVLDAQVAAWNKGDLDTFMAGYWKSPDLTFFSGKTEIRGWQATLDRYHKRYKSKDEMGKLAFSNLKIELLGSDYAIVRGHWQLTLKDANPGGVFTLILKKLPEGWRIIHDHTSTS